MRSSVLLSCTCVAVLSLTAEARAQEHESEYPVSFVERPLTLPRFALAPQLELDLDNIRVDVVTANGVASASAVLAGMQIGAAFGITRDLEIGATVLPIQFTAPAGYGGQFVGEEGFSGNPMLFGTFRFLHNRMFDLGARLRVQIAPPNDGFGAGALIEPSVPLLLHLGKLARFDAEVGIPITVKGGATADGVTAGSTTTVGLDVPVRLAFDIIEPLHVGVSTGVRIDDFGDGGDAAIPLGVFGGYAIGEKRPILDLDAFLNFFDFITPGGGLSGNKINPGVLVFGISARGYFYF